MEVAYGFCILIQDSIIEYPTLTLSPEDYPDDDIFLEHCAYFDALFESPFDPAQISHMGPALNRYGFKEPNTASYRKDRILTLEEFEKEKNRELRTICQHALHGARGFFCEMDEQMHILYDFGHILLINNAMDTEEYDRYLGASFNYPNHWLPRPEGDTTEFGLYDKCAITGVLFIK
ncbi:MAG: hypothetical protein LUF04_08325 [Bacteroides sp.]|nr:hypothetical protein [Bacteroides sp.]